MRQILFSKIRRQKWVAITFILALLTILIVLPVSINSILNAQQDVESNITHYARGSYDLLVRAEGNQHPLEEVSYQKTISDLVTVAYLLTNGKPF